MTRQRKDDAIHNLKRENKELKDEVQKLKRQINNDAKEDKRAEKVSKAKAKSEPAPRDPAACPDCQNGKIEVVELGVRKMVSCTLQCGYRKVVKNA